MCPLHLLLTQAHLLQALLLLDMQAVAAQQISFSQEFQLVVVKDKQE